VWQDVVNGVYKSCVFGGLVTLHATYQGYTTAPTSEGVAYATTRTVVYSSIATLAVDFLMTAFLM
jgi:phospholipid/cholesterol/gamma-HCH transport system permease protein